MLVALAAAVILNFCLSGAWALTLPQTMLSGMNRLVLIALPLFVLAGGLMYAGGISAKLFEFARALVGWMRGGLAHVNVLTSMFFGGMIGSSTADLAGTGSIVIPAMKENGYPAPFSAALTASSAGIAPMDEFAETEDGEGDDSDDEAAHPLGGLHAKVFVQENGWDTAITIGSGNATRPALLTGRNVEVFATLTGKRSRVGSISDIFGPDGFGRVLRAFRPAEIPQRDAGPRAAEQRIERARRELVNAGLALSCTARKDEEGGQGLWKVILQPGQSTPLDGLGSATCWPITLGEAHAHDVLMALRDGDSIEIGTMPLIDVTRFVAFRLTDATHEETTALFALGLRINGCARRDRVCNRTAPGQRGPHRCALHLLEPGDRRPEHQPTQCTRQGGIRTAHANDALALAVGRRPWTWSQQGQLHQPHTGNDVQSAVVHRCQQGAGASVPPPRSCSTIRIARATPHVRFCSPRRRIEC